MRALRAEQLRRTIAGLTYDNGTVATETGSGTPISASFGIASTIGSGYDLRLLLAHADSALYAAKRAGRNRVAVYDTNVSRESAAQVHHPAARRRSFGEAPLGMPRSWASQDARTFRSGSPPPPASVARGYS